MSTEPSFESELETADAVPPAELSASVETAVAAEVAPPAEPFGADLRFSVACPKCGTLGWLKWTSLKYRIGCPKCRCAFSVGRNGQLQAQDDAPQVRYECPRCHQAGSLPKQLAVRGVECTACKLPLEPGPDRKLHEAKKAQELRRAAAREAKQTSTKEWMMNAFRDDTGRIRHFPILLGIAVAIALLIGGYMIVAPWFDASPGARARHFTYACLAGKWNDALGYMADDDVQRVQFDRWKVRYFPSILDKHRPKGDSVRITAETLEESPQACVLQVTMTSPAIGTRSHRQRWHYEEGKWRFDAHGTVSEIP